MRAWNEIAIVRYEGGAPSLAQDVVIAECPFEIRLDGQPYASVMAMPEKLDDLAIGLLYGEGAIETAADVASVAIDEARGQIAVTRVHSRAVSPEDRVRTTGFGLGSTPKRQLDAAPLPVEGRDPLQASDIVALMDEFNARSQLFRDTGAVHSCCLCAGETRLFADDVGRHNALDKVIGASLRLAFDRAAAALLTTGRVSTEILIKTAKAGIPTLISRSAPTDRAVALARSSGMTLVGFARGQRFNVYAGEERIR